MVLRVTAATVKSASIRIAKHTAIWCVVFAVPVLALFALSGLPKLYTVILVILALVLVNASLFGTLSVFVLYAWDKGAGWWMVLAILVPGLVFGLPEEIGEVVEIGMYGSVFSVVFFGAAFVAVVLGARAVHRRIVAAVKRGGSRGVVG